MTGDRLVLPRAISRYLSLAPHTRIWSPSIFFMVLASEPSKKKTSLARGLYSNRPQTSQQIATAKEKRFIFILVRGREEIVFINNNVSVSKVARRFLGPGTVTHTL